MAGRASSPKRVNGKRAKRPASATRNRRPNSRTEAFRLLKIISRALEPDVRSQIDRTLAQFAHPAIRFDHVVTRRAGQRRFLDLHMHMPASWTLGRAAALRSDVEQALMSEVPGLRASIQLLPSDVEAHFNDPVDPQL